VNLELRYEALEPRAGVRLAIVLRAAIPTDIAVGTEAAVHLSALEDASATDRRERTTFGCAISLRRR
jgi:hypothetical protein